MDLYWDKYYVEEQKKLFVPKSIGPKKKFAIAIHCRDAFDEVFEVLEDEKDDKLKGVFHCFTGSVEQANRAIALNFYLGIGGVVTFKSRD